MKSTVETQAARRSGFSAAFKYIVLVLALGSGLGLGLVRIRVRRLAVEGGIGAHAYRCREASIRVLFYSSFCISTMSPITLSTILLV